MNSARAFMRREDYAPRASPAESPFREFLVSCLHCQSFRVRTVIEFNEDAGETWIVLRCRTCGKVERLATGWTAPPCPAPPNKTAASGQAGGGCLQTCAVSVL